VDEDVVG